MRPSLRWSFLALVGLAFPSSLDAAESLRDLTRAVVVFSDKLSGSEREAVSMLLEEVEKRSQIRWTTTSRWPAEGAPVIAVGKAAELASFAGRFAQELSRASRAAKAEGYHLKVVERGSAPVVLIAGEDARGVLFGVGHLLRSLRMTRGNIAVPGGLDIATAPHYPLRGHQLGYRPKTNSYDGWTLAIWEQYIRDLAVFGTNAIELIPPRSDDDADSPHFPLHPLETMTGVSRICDRYGLDVWIWYPALDKDYTDPKTVEFALNEWGEVFRRLPRVDAVFVPGGDPGHTQPRTLMALLEKQSDMLRRYHPQAGVWMAPQGFNREWMDEFAGLIQQEPAWLAGIVYGPQTRLTLAQLRALVPKKYPIRHYPDITHSRHSQYPVPDWDTAFALIEGREVINPRPNDQAMIFRLLQPLTIGFIAYSEGCNDDVNKFVWSGLGWNPRAEVIEILRDYSRYFIGPGYADSFAQGLLALEQNWRGPVLTNGGIQTTLQQFQSLERAASPQALLNWRFQQALYRAYTDAYVRRRLLHETALEDRAMEFLRNARRFGSLVAISQAEAALEEAVSNPVAQDWRARIFALGEALFQSIRMQLSVERYKAISVGRGATLDTVDLPLNNRYWLKERFEAIRRLADDEERLRQIDEIVNWTDPGPGGFYDDLGNLTRQPHLVRGAGFATDPGFYESSLPIVERSDHSPSLRMSWWDQAITFFDQPLQMHYSHLDPNASYRIRVVYGGGPIRLMAGDRWEVHTYLQKTYQPLEFDIPREATADGKLRLSWNREPGGGGAGRGCQVAEVWLMKK